MDIPSIATEGPNSNTVKPPGGLDRHAFMDIVGFDRASTLEDLYPRLLQYAAHLPLIQKNERIYVRDLCIGELKRLGVTEAAKVLDGFESVSLREKEEQTEFSAPTVAELIEVLGDDPGQDWVLPGYMARGNLTVFAGYGKGGKSTFTSNMAAAIVMGASTLDRQVQRGPVLWLDLEQDIRLTLAKFKALGIDTEPVHIHNDRKWRYSESRLSKLKKFITDRGIVLIIVDSLSKYWRGLVTKEEDNVEVETAMATLIELARDTNAAVLAIHHFRKNGTENPDLLNVRGAGAIINTADIVVGFGRPKGAAKDTTQRLLESISRYEETPKTYVVDWRDGIYVGLGSEVVVERNDMNKRALAVVNGADEELSADDVAEALGMKKSNSSLREALKELAKTEKVNRRKEKTAFLYSRKDLSVGTSLLEQTDRQSVTVDLEPKGSKPIAEAA